MHTMISFPQQAGNTIKFLYSVQAGKEGADADPAFGDEPTFGGVHRRLPDGTLDLVFNLGDPVYSSRDGGVYERLPDVMLAGLYPDRNFVRYEGRVDLVVAVLQPGAAHLFVNDRLEIFRECAGDAALIWGKEVYNVLDQLKTTREEAAQHRLVEQFLLSKYREPRQNGDAALLSRILSAVEEIHSAEGAIELSGLYPRVYMSERNFRRRFTEWVGMPPKQYAGIIRVKAFSKKYAAGRKEGMIGKGTSDKGVCDKGVSDKGVNGKGISGERIRGMGAGAGVGVGAWRQVDWVNELGYTDGSHFRKDFQRIAGLSPADYFGELGSFGKRFIETI